jgi:predicted alpha/beta superfamily hydrolase
MMCLRPLLPALFLLPCCSSSAGVSGARDASTSLESGTPLPEAGAPESSSAPPDAASMSDAPSAPDAPSPDAPSGVTTLRVHYPAGSHTITLRGSNLPYSWNAGVPLTPGPDDTWTLTTAAITAPLQWKPLLDDTTWSQGPNYYVTPGASVDIYPHFTTTAGSWSLAFQYTSTILGNTRGIYVYIPPSYNENTDASFPVVYMHDGQNLFDPAASFSGVVWQINTAMDNGAADGSIAEAVVIGIDNTPNRIAEYTPVPDPTVDAGGAIGAEYIEALIEELKPQIDSMYRTIPDRAHTFMMGSSLGGLITAYAGVVRSDVYGAVGALSPSTWWDNDWIIGEVGTIPMQPQRAIRVYVDSGNAGDPTDDDEADTAMLAAEYETVGYVMGTTLDYWVQNGGEHNETYWAQRAPVALGFVVGPRAYLPPP